MFCTNCGDWSPDTARFCNQCGAGLSAKPAAAAEPAAKAAAASFLDRVRMLAATDKLEGFSLSGMFSEVFKRRTDDEVEEYFVTGTSKATPPIDQVAIGWPKPWFFARVLAFVGLVSLVLYYCFEIFQNTKFLPGLMTMGTLTVPFATMILFFEFNTPRNVPFYRLMMLFMFGGVTSILISLFGFEYSSLEWLGASSAGIVEEIGKLLAVVIFCRQKKYKYILNGLLFGAAVGAGFSAFESSGYAFEKLWKSSDVDVMLGTMYTRAFLAPFGHVPRTAIAAAALWRAKGDRSFSPSMLVDPVFLKTFSIPVVLHMIWNAPIPSPFSIIQLSMGLIGWIVVLGLAQQGLQQVRDEQRKAAKTMLATRSAAAPN